MCAGERHEVGRKRGKMRGRGGKRYEKKVETYLIESGERET